MKKNYFFLPTLLIIVWAISFFVLHAGVAIHTIMALAIAILLRGILCAKILVLDGSKKSIDTCSED